MTFIANQSPPPVEAEPIVENDGWFPDIDPAKVREQARLDGTVTAVRLRQAIMQAITDVNHELAARKILLLAEGVSALDDLAGPEVGGVSVWLIHYQTAICAHVQANLSELYRDFTTTGQAEDMAQAMEARASEHRRNMRWAISALLGVSRTTVELI